MKNCHYIKRDPTANIAIANVDRETRRKEEAHTRKRISALTEEDIKEMDFIRNKAKSFLKYLERKTNEEYDTGLE